MSVSGTLVAVVFMGWFAFLARSIYTSQRRVKTREMDMWRASAVAISLEEVEEYWAVHQGIRGRCGPLQVEIEGASGTDGAATPRVRIIGSSGITVRLEGFGTGIEKAVRPDHEIGDPEFDRDVYVTGLPDIVRAVLDADARLLLRELLHGHVQPGTHSALTSLRDGVLEVGFRDSNSQAFPPRLPLLLATLVDLGRRLEPPARIPERIAANTLVETLWQVRLENLRLLVDMYRHAPETTQALEHGCQDAHDEIRLLAASALGEGGSGTLWELASRPSTDASCAARAIVALGALLPRERALALLAQAFAAGRTEVAQACVESLGRSGSPEMVPAIVPILDASDGNLASAAARALGASDSATAEAPLLVALESGFSSLRLAAAEALGHIGTIAAVLPLKAIVLAEADDDTEAHRRAARQAIAQIQSRIAGAEPGQISLAGDATGQLSLTDDTSGQLSVAVSAVAEKEPTV
jgi:HEAT repeats